LIVVFTLLILSAIYGIVILGLVFWEESHHLEFPGLWSSNGNPHSLGMADRFERFYNLSIQYFGDSSSPQAHYTIPWILRIPQVYVMASLILCGLVSLPLQWVSNRGLKVSKENAR